MSPAPHRGRPARRSTVADDGKQPTLLTADRVRSHRPERDHCRRECGAARAGKTLTADKLTYWQDEDEAEAVGSVVLTEDQNRIRGPKLRMKLERQFGYFEQPEYSITRVPEEGAAAQTQKKAAQRADWLTGEPLPAAPEPPITATGSAQRMDFEGENHYRMTNATYSTCTPEDYDWYARGESVVLDYDRDRGEAKNMTLVFKDVPFFYVPWADFSLSGERKSGFLAPTFGSSNKTGLSLIVPYYWNIAPNMDATIAPRIMTRRGLQLGGELRYLELTTRRVAGRVSGRAIGSRANPVAPTVGITRSSFPYGFSASANVAGVSDDTYFTDLGSHTTITSQTNLLRQGTLSYGGGWWYDSGNRCSAIRRCRIRPNRLS